MDSKSLMIGDWVQYDRSYPPMGIMKPIKVTLQDVIDIAQCEDCEPIPLTAEILEMNGFWYGLTTEQEDLMSAGLGVPMTAQRSWVWEDEAGGVVTLDFPNEADGGQVCCLTDKKDSSLVWYDSLNVHELQHALRLCGLNKLAENFKVW